MYTYFKQTKSNVPNKYYTFLKKISNLNGWRAVASSKAVPCENELYSTGIKSKWKKEN